MNKKFYEAPSQEIVEAEVLSVLCASADNPLDDSTAGTETME